jgi:lysozyme family protein
VVAPLLRYFVIKKKKKSLKKQQLYNNQMQRIPVFWNFLVPLLCVGEKSLLTAFYLFTGEPVRSRKFQHGQTGKYDSS